MKNALRTLDGRRKQHLKGLEVALLKLMRRRSGRQSRLLDCAEVESVLIVRNNQRIGNVIFLLPFVDRVMRQYPNARVELLLSYSWQGPVFDHFGLGEIHYSQLGWRSLPAFIKTLVRLRRKAYDLVLIPYNGSSDRLVATQLSGKNIVAHQGPANDAVCTHTFPSKRLYRHYALGCMELLESLGETTGLEQPRVALALTERELAQAEGELTALLGSERAGPRLAYFRGARGAKVIPDTQWRALLAKFREHYNGDVQLIEILSPDVTEPLEEADFTYSTASLRGLGAFLSHVPLFLCGDTGPLHLASSAGAHCVGLFTATDVERYGCLGDMVVNVEAIDQLEPKRVLEAFAAMQVPE